MVNICSNCIQSIMIYMFRNCNNGEQNRESLLAGSKYSLSCFRIRSLIEYCTINHYKLPHYFYKIWNTNLIEKICFFYFYLLFEFFVFWGFLQTQGLLIKRRRKGTGLRVTLRRVCTVLIRRFLATGKFMLL